VIASGEAELVDVTSEEPLSYAWYVDFPQKSLAEGDYTVRFYSTERSLDLGSFPVKVLPNPGTLSYSPATVSCTIEKGKWSQTSPAVIDRNTDVTVNIPVTSGQFSRPVRLAWGATTAKIAGQTEPQIIVQRAGGVGTHTFKAPFANVVMQSKYYGLMVMSVDDNNKPICLNDFGVSKRVWFTVTGELGGVEGGVDDVIADGVDAVALYPNPVIDTFTVEGNGIEEVSVYSLAGVQVLKANGNGEDAVVVNASDLTSGHYIVTVATADGTVAKRMIKR
ncbi:MAG: T9SS type A sorting domain-containing protein, partial [Muribaculaceae bacterium]|nr:T9SS type A sorting domain-containing protein [Muribaculaceae bacterium]